MDYRFRGNDRKSAPLSIRVQAKLIAHIHTSRSFMRFVVKKDKSEIASSPCSSQ